MKWKHQVFSDLTRQIAVGWFAFVIIIVFDELLFHRCHHITVCMETVCLWAPARLEVGVLCMEHMATEACDSLRLCLWNYAGLYSLFPPWLGQPITLCHRLKQRCHLTILSQIWKHVYLCGTATGLSFWMKTLSCPVCLRAGKNGALWKMRKEVVLKHVLRFK